MNFDRTTGEINRHVRIVRVLVDKHIRLIDPDYTAAMASLSAIEGIAFAILSHNETKPAVKEPEKPKGRKEPR